MNTGQIVKSKQSGNYFADAIKETDISEQKILLSKCGLFSNTNINLIAQVYLMNMSGNIFKVGMSSDSTRRQKKLKAKEVIVCSRKMCYAICGFFESKIINFCNDSFGKFKGKKEYFYLDNSELNILVEKIKNI